MAQWIALSLSTASRSKIEFETESRQSGLSVDFLGLKPQDLLTTWFALFDRWAQKTYFQASLNLKETIIS